MTPRDLADLLLRKARDEAQVVRSVRADPEVADWIVGFHAQQAIEKALKAVLTVLGIRYGRTHDLGALLELLSEAHIEAPDWISEAAVLNPFGVALRYAELDVDQPLDRAAIMPLVARVVAWATDRVEEIALS